MKSARKAHLKLGRRGENAAWKFLESKECELIARNWRVKAGELDLVVLDGETLVFVEVKTLRRKGVFRPLDNLSMLQIKRNARAAARYWNALGNPDMPTRFDLIEVVMSRWGICDIRHHYGYQPPLSLRKTSYALEW
ncbi:MAG: YraN family protein [Lentisphaeria bacterium]|nr:YraN family protein [Lentisphaeria bacterium]